LVIIPEFQYSIALPANSSALSVTDLWNQLKSFNDFFLFAKNSLPKEPAAPLSLYTFSDYSKLSPFPHRTGKGSNEWL
jgi:hypothetical protein